MTDPDDSQIASAAVEEGRENDELAMAPDHALLQRVQEALREQLLQIHLDLTERVRERQKDAQARRQEYGVELYGFQERQATLYTRLEQIENHANTANERRIATEEERTAKSDEARIENEKSGEERTKEERARAELEQLSAAVQHIDRYNAETRDALRVAQREAEATESVSRQLGKEKDEQDFLIVDLQKSLKRREQEKETLQSQLEAQIAEKQLAHETLAEAQRDMENVHYEKKQLLSVWKSSLVFLQQKDAALQKSESLLIDQTQRVVEIENERHATRKQLSRQKETIAQTQELIERTETDARAVSTKTHDCVQRRGDLESELTRVEGSVLDVNSDLENAQREAEEIEKAAESCRKQYVRICRETQELHDVVLTAMHEQTTTKRSAQKALADIEKLVKSRQKSEMSAVDVRNDIAKLHVDILNTQRHNLQLKETMTALEEELEQRVGAVTQMESESSKRDSEIEKRTRELDSLNRRYQQLTANMEDEATGPLEATINNLQREIRNKGSESQELQRQWMHQQIELVALEHENSQRVENLAAMQAKTTVMKQKTRRLEAQLEQQVTAMKGLKVGMGRLHKDIQSLNGVIAKNETLSQLLESQTFAIETEIQSEMRNMEAASRQIEATLQHATEEKRDVLAQLVETEKQIMLWERRLELEREMQAALEPDVGEDVAQTIRKEIHRMELTLADLHRQQESLIRDMEVAVHKRQNIRFKSEALKSRDSTEAQLERGCHDLKRSVRATQKELDATVVRIRVLQDQRSEQVTGLEAAEKLFAMEARRHDELQTKLKEARCAV